MKHLATPILEFVLTQPAHKLPVVFTLEECPLPDCEESPEDVLGEVLRLQREGWIEAHVTRGVDGKPKRVEIRYITGAGRINLEGRNSRGQENTAARGLLSWGIAGLFILVLVAFWALGGRSGNSPRGERHAPLASDRSEVKPAPTPAPTPSPEPSATPEVSPAPALAPTPSATPIPQPEASPSPSPASAHKRVNR